MPWPSSTANPILFETAFATLKDTFERGVTKDLDWRKATLRQFLKMIEENHEKWSEAFIEDMGGGRIRPLLEIGPVKEEIELCLARMDKWAADRPASLGDPMSEVPMFDRRVVRPTPKGVMLVMGAWNFPINLCFVPCVSMLAAGNCVIIKPSELASAVATLMQDLVHKYLPKEAVCVLQGGVPETTEILKLPFDHICYTGSSAVGKIVMTAAAQNLTPCTLELGGKNPTFVHRSANLKLAAERTVVVKTTNAGQWCTDADYVMVDESATTELVRHIVSAASSICGDANAQRGEEIDASVAWCTRIISEGHARRLRSYLEEDHGGKVVMGGLEHCDVDAKFIPFTVVVDPRDDTKLMTEEIFGPILVIKSVRSVDHAVTTMKRVCATPLALYVYSEDKQYTEHILSTCTSGSVGVNTTCEQMIADTVPFGGVGQSGYGAYKGVHGFNEFSHMRSIMYRTTMLPMMVLPKQTWPVANKFPSWMLTFVLRKAVLGLMPGWLKTVLKASIAVALAAAVVALRARFA